MKLSNEELSKYSLSLLQQYAALTEKHLNHKMFLRVCKRRISADMLLLLLSSIDIDRGPKNPVSFSSIKEVVFILLYFIMYMYRCCSYCVLPLQKVTVSSSATANTRPSTAMHLV